MNAKKPTKRKLPRSAEIDVLEAASREREARELAYARRMVLNRAMAAGEAIAHGDAEIGAKLTALAEGFMRHVLELAVRPYTREKAKVKYRHALNPGGRPKGADLGGAWLDRYEEKKRTSRGRTASEIYGDIADEHRVQTGKAYPEGYIKKLISLARTERRTAAAKGRFR